jgi:hypothetical protein
MIESFAIAHFPFFGLNREIAAAFDLRFGARHIGRLEQCGFRLEEFCE